MFCAALLLSCDATSVAGPVPACDHIVTGVTPEMGPSGGGTEVTVSGTFIAGDSDRDVQVRVGAVDALVLSMTRTGCDTCDACANEALLCVTCDRECRGLAEFTDASGVVWGASQCLETLVFETPAGEPGPAPVVILNSRGSSDDIVFTYEGTGDDDDSATGDDDDSATGDDDDSATGDDDDSATGDDDDSATGDDDDSATGDDDDSATGDDDDDSATGDDDDSAAP